MIGHEMKSQDDGERNRVIWENEDVVLDGGSESAWIQEITEENLERCITESEEDSGKWV